MVRRSTTVFQDSSAAYLTIANIMERLQVSRPTVYKFFDTGLPRYKVGKSVRVSSHAFEKWLSTHERCS